MNKMNDNNDMQEQEDELTLTVISQPCLEEDGCYCENDCPAIIKVMKKQRHRKQSKIDFNNCLKSITDLGYIRYRNQRYRQYDDGQDGCYWDIWN